MQCAQQTTFSLATMCVSPSRPSTLIGLGLLSSRTLPISSKMACIYTHLYRIFTQFDYFYKYIAICIATQDLCFGIYNTQYFKENGRTCDTAPLGRHLFWKPIAGGWGSGRPVVVPPPPKHEKTPPCGRGFFGLRLFRFRTILTRMRHLANVRAHFSDGIGDCLTARFNLVLVKKGSNFGEEATILIPTGTGLLAGHHSFP